jgi:hypothetical protein
MQQLYITNNAVTSTCCDANVADAVAAVAAFAITRIWIESESQFHVSNYV